MDNIGIELKKVRILNNIKQKEMADFMGVTQSYISRVENGKEIPSKMFIKLFTLKYLEIPIEDSVGNRFRSVRRKKGLDLDTFANQLGITVEELNNIESNNQKPSNTLLKLMSKLYKVNEDWIVTGDVLCH